MSTVWQIGAGDKEKDLVPTMIEKRIMIFGPGNVGDIRGKDKQMLISLKCTETQARSLLDFRDDVKEGQIVVLRLGSVCFVVGAIEGKYEWREEFNKVHSYWNKDRKYCEKEKGWDLQHTRAVKWFVLKCEEAFYCFRRGIYGKTGFSRVHNPDLHEYLEKLGYDGTNGKDILEKIGDPVFSINQYGFPDAKGQARM